MTDSERAAIRAQAFKEAAEIARTQGKREIYMTLRDHFFRSDAGAEHDMLARKTANHIANAIEAAAKGAQK